MKEVSIYKIPLYYISFERNIDLENDLKSQGFIDINHFKAINGRKFNEEDLLRDKIITIRSYQDLKSGRDQHQGIPSLGAIGCSFSHYELWKKCINDNIPYITIVEEDADFSKKISKDDIHKINNTLSKPRSFYISELFMDDDKFIGTQFYCSSNYVCRQFVDRFFPIDVQLDWYLNYIVDLDNSINKEVFKTITQKSHESSIQDLCMKCIMPTNPVPYILLIVLVILVVIVLIVRRRCFFSDRCK